MHLNVEKKLLLPAVPDSILRATAFVDSLLEGIGCPPKAHSQLSVIIDEIFSNIVHHAKGAETAEIRFTFTPETRTVRLTFADRGIPYNPLRYETPDVTLPAEKRAIGGLGIFLVRKLADGISYEYADGKNILSIDKRI